MTRAISTKQLLTALKAAGETTRLRILALLATGELNVTDLTQILDQSQPRISRHLRLLDEAGLIERFREGSFVYCRLAQKEVVGELVNQAIRLLDRQEPVLRDDRKRAVEIQQTRIEASQVWFRANAAKWDQIRSLYVSDRKVETAMRDMLQSETKDHKYEMLFDLGTGTGRVLELFAGKAQQAIGIDTSHSMLEVARARLKGQDFEHCQVRQGDVIDLPYADGLADIAILHQVLHFLIDPEKAVQESARLLQPGGQLLIVDFAPHNLDFFREDFAHERLGFSNRQIETWLKKAGLVATQFVQLATDERDRDTANAQELMVSLWLAEKKSAVGPGTGKDETGNSQRMATGSGAHKMKKSCAKGDASPKQLEIIQGSAE